MMRSYLLPTSDTPKKNEKWISVRFISLFLILFTVCAMAPSLRAMTAEVKNHLGSPTIMVDGKPQTPLILWAFSTPQRASTVVKANPRWQQYTTSFTAPQDDPGLCAIHLRMGGTTGTIWLDNVRFFEGDANATNPVNMLQQGDFEGSRAETDGAWVLFRGDPNANIATWDFDAADKVSGKQSCRIQITKIPSGGGTANMIYQGLKIQKGKRYTLSLWIKADREHPVEVVAIHHADPWTVYTGKEGPITAAPLMKSEISLAKKAGVHLFSTEMNMPWPKPGEKADFSNVDAMMDAMISVDPQILVLPRFYPMPPQWWLDSHPGSEMVFNDPKIKGYVSVASKEWLKDACENMRVFIRHLEDKYGDHLIAYQPGMQENGEWFYWKMGDGSLFSGFEESYRTGFARWAEKKYKTEEKLRKAWGQPEVTFTTVRVPSVGERTNAPLGLLYDPATQKFQIDFSEYMNVVNSDAIIALAHAIKQETKGKKLSMFFYGYYFELGGLHASGHLGLGRVLRSPDVDILAGPLSYSEREPGGTIPMMSPVDSVREAGKIWLNEDDTRTYMVSEATAKASPPAWVQKTPVDTLRAHRRQFGHLLPRRLASWYMDLGNEGWVNGEDIWQNIGEMKKIYDREMQIATPWNPEVAIVVDERSTYYTQHWIADLNSGFRFQFYRMGTNFRMLLLDDVLAGRAKLPKVTMFSNCLHLTPADREKLKEATKGKTAVWLYGSGYLDDDRATASNMKDLMGFSFKEFPTGGVTTIRFAAESSLAKGLEKMDFTPSLTSTKPLWSINSDPSIKPFATFPDGSIAAASRTTEGGGRIIYVGTLGCPSTVLRNILKEAGVRLYIDSNDVLDTDGRFLSLTASTAGPKTISVPAGMNLFKEGNPNPLELKNGQFTEPFELGEVRFYCLEPQTK